MTTIDDMLDRVREFNVLEESGQAIENTREDMKRIQREQMLQGLNADGVPIGQYKSDKYAAMKAAMNPLPGFGNVDLKLTGSFQDELFVDVRGEEYIIDSADSKAVFLIENYTDKAIGLNDASLDKYAQEYAGPQLIEQAREKLGL